MGKKGFWIIGGLIVIFLCFHMKYYADSKAEGKSVYHITVDDGSEDATTYTTNEYHIEDGCIKFKDMLGLKQTVCGHYSITEY